MCKCIAGKCTAICSCVCHDGMLGRPRAKPSYTGVATVYSLDTYKRCLKMGYDKRAAIEMARYKHTSETPPPVPEFIAPIKKEMA